MLFSRSDLNVVKVPRFRQNESPSPRDSFICGPHRQFAHQSARPDWSAGLVGLQCWPGRSALMASSDCTAGEGGLQCWPSRTAVLARPDCNAGQPGLQCSPSDQTAATNALEWTRVFLLKRSVIPLSTNNSVVKD